MTKVKYTDGNKTGETLNIKLVDPNNKSVVSDLKANGWKLVIEDKKNKSE